MRPSLVLYLSIISLTILVITEASPQPGSDNRGTRSGGGKRKTTTTEETPTDEEKDNEDDDKEESSAGGLSTGSRKLSRKHAESHQKAENQEQGASVTSRRKVVIKQHQDETRD